MKKNSNFNFPNFFRYTHHVFVRNKQKKISLLLSSIFQISYSKQEKNIFYRNLELAAVYL